MKNFKSVIIITDCLDHNARGRQETRAQTLFGVPTIFIPVVHEYEAAGILVDVLDSIDKDESVGIIVNIAPRGGHTRKWENGTPFGYFTFGNSVIVSTLDGYVLSLVKKMGLIDTLYKTEIKEVAPLFVVENLINQNEVAYIENTQFRSFEYAPRLLYLLSLKRDVPKEIYTLDMIPDMPHAVWFVDNFGNCKTTILESDITYTEGSDFVFLNEHIKMTRQLKTVADSEAALTVGSSGFKEKRFLEIAINRGNASKHFVLQAGSVLS